MTTAEMEEHGTVFTTRFKLRHEKVEALQDIETTSKPDSHSEMGDVTPIMTGPTLVQKPHPPVIGGSVPHAAWRVALRGRLAPQGEPCTRPT